MSSFQRAYPEASFWLKVVGWIFIGPTVIAYAVCKWAVGKLRRPPQRSGFVGAWDSGRTDNSIRVKDRDSRGS